MLRVELWDKLRNNRVIQDGKFIGLTLIPVYETFLNNHLYLSKQPLRPSTIIHSFVEVIRVKHD